MGGGVGDWGLVAIRRIHCSLVVSFLILFFFYIQAIHRSSLSICFLSVLDE